jgi:hypothetical protein
VNPLRIIFALYFPLQQNTSFHVPISHCR